MINNVQYHHVLVAIALVTLSTMSHAESSDDFERLLGDHWQWQLSTEPVFASRLGDRRFNRQWADQSVAGYERRNEERKAFRARVYGIDRTALSREEQLNYELFRRLLEDDIAAFEFDGHLLPFSHRGGVQNLDSVTNQLRMIEVQDFSDWIARLEKIDALIEQTIDRAERGRRSGIIAPKILMQRITSQLALQVVENPAESPFFRIFDKLPERMSAADREQLRAAAVDAIDTHVLPSYRRLNQYFNETYLPASRDSVGLSRLQGGSEWYEHLATSFTTTRMTPDDIHRLGLREVKRIRDEMQSVIAEVDFAGSFDEFLEHLRTDPRFYHDTPEALLDDYLATSKRIDPELVKLFGVLPRMPYGVKPIPEAIAPDTTTAYYSRPAADGSRAGIYWVNLYRPEVRPKYEIEVLSVHEAMPGHHLQLALQQELDNIPNFRRFMGFTAFVEGWGLYSERLGYDLGLYRDPYSRFGQLTYDMWRAVRLVVDTGLHYKGWTREQAINFFKDNAAKAEHDIVNEIDRYIGNPGQALAYKVGQLKILTLRERAERQLGDRFDIRAFHDHLLGAGALPLDLLERRMDAWLVKQSALTEQQ